MGVSGGSKGIGNPTGGAAFRADLANILDDVRRQIDKEVESFGDLGSLPESWAGQQAWVKDEKRLYVEDDDDGWSPAIPDPTPGVLHVREEQASGTNGGTFTSGAWQTRVLNVEKTNTITGASLAANQIILPAGDYELEADAPAWIVDFHKAKIRRVSGTPGDLLIGTSEYALTSGGVYNRSIVRGTFTLAAPTTLELQHRCSTTAATWGFGRAVSFSVVEVFAEVIIHKVG